MKNLTYQKLIEFINSITLNRTLLTTDRLVVIYNEVLKTNHLDGDYAELGVYKGGVSKLILECSIKNNIHLFDTFDGIPEDDIMPNGHLKGHFNESLTNVQSYINDSRAIYHKGVFPSTSIDNLQFKLVHLDADIYQSTIEALKYFWPRLIVGGTIILDDLDWEACQGVRKALNEYFSNNINIYTYTSQQGVIYKTI